MKDEAGSLFLVFITINAQQTYHLHCLACNIRQCHFLAYDVTGL